MKAPRILWPFLVFLFVLNFQASAQRETDHWFFGSWAGLHFQNNNPVPQQSSQMRAREGCAAISDSTGNLLFYTAGDTVYNKFHQKMNNGWLMHGHQSSSQSSVIVQNPYSLHLYYLFTVDALGGQNGLKYSIIDVTALGGQGSVLAKNIPLMTPVAEKITAVDHGYSRDAWVIVHGSSTQNDKFYAYRITPTGVNLSPVVSQVPNAVLHAGTFPNNLAIGCMKASPDGRKLALAMQELNLVELYDFNDSTGVVSNPLRITGLNKAYGVEFSRDASKLYVSTQSTAVDILQFDLEAGSGPAIITSRRTALATKAIFSSSLQLSRNGRIYVANTETGTGNRNIRVINMPDSSTASLSFSAGSQPLNPSGASGYRYSEQGLPNFNQSYLWLPSFISKKYCLGDVTEFTLKIKRKVKSIRWNFGDPNSGSNNTSTLLNPTHQYHQPGTYTVTLTATLFNNRTRSTTAQIIVYPRPEHTLGLNQELCQGRSIKLQGPKDMKNYQWSTGDTGTTIEVSKPGTYWLEITTPNGCSSRQSIIISPVSNSPKFFDKYVYETCPFRPVTIAPRFTGKNMRWNTGSTDSIIHPSREGWYRLTMVIDSCIVSDSVQVVFKSCPEDFMVPNIITPNGDGQNETFMIRGTLPGDWHLRIYNRWGQLLYEQEKYRNDWPRKKPSSGTYYYILKNSNGQQYKGWLEVAD